MMDKYLRPYLKKIGIAPHEFLNLGLRVMASGSDLFSLTVLGIHLSSATNAVSRLHGQTTRRLWSDLWRGLPWIIFQSITLPTAFILLHGLRLRWKGFLINI